MEVFGLFSILSALGLVTRKHIINTRNAKIISNTIKTQRVTYNHKLTVPQTVQLSCILTNKKYPCMIMYVKSEQDLIRAPIVKPVSLEINRTIQFNTYTYNPIISNPFHVHFSTVDKFVTHPIRVSTLGVTDKERYTSHINGHFTPYLIILHIINDNKSYVSDSSIILSHVATKWI